MSVEFDGRSVYDRIAASLVRAAELLELASAASTSEVAEDLIALSARWSALAERLQQQLHKESSVGAARSSALSCHASR